jgi:hypothetical protein
VPSEPVFVRVRFSQELPPVTLYAIRTGASGIAVPLLDKLPLISTLKLVYVVVLLQEMSIADCACGAGVGVGAGVAVGAGVETGVGLGVTVGVEVGVAVGVGVGVAVEVDDASIFTLIITLVSESSIDR